MTKKEIRRTKEYKNLKYERKSKLSRNKLIEKLEFNIFDELKEMREYLEEKLDEIHITDIILDYKNNWYEISQYEYLEEYFIREYQDKVDWEMISIFQKLSESFIREFQDKVDWFQISQRQNLSKSVIHEFQDELTLSFISYEERGENMKYYHHIGWVLSNLNLNIYNN